MKTPWKVAIAGALAVGAGGAYMSIQQNPQDPQHIADAYVVANIKNDSKAIGELLGLGDSPMEQVLGTVMGAALNTYWSDQAQNPEDFHWTLIPQQHTEAVTEYIIDLHTPNYGALADKEMELLGYRTDEDGVLTVAEEPQITVEEAERQARADPTIKPLHFRVPLQLIRKQNTWIVNPDQEENNAIFTVIRRGDSSTENLKYLITPEQKQ
ncbi:hypothetical protein GO986_14885 [Deinococcus sp. HMF7620]|uniref:Uncharacterized protein n=1 Tax=Deinococcus arboris TaxID=2682977 RepID=A0A7C9LM84_9DEIO|nr:hypothetical protein [Deinococcus arboris]MVN88038.1 hypothetical protein [Deinococcus arboris]